MFDYESSNKTSKLLIAATCIGAVVAYHNLNMLFHIWPPLIFVLFIYIAEIEDILIVANNNKIGALNAMVLRNNEGGGVIEYNSGKKIESLFYLFLSPIYRCLQALVLGSLVVTGYIVLMAILKVFFAVF